MPCKTGWLPKVIKLVKKRKVYHIVVMHLFVLWVKSVCDAEQMPLADGVEAGHVVALY